MDIGKINNLLVWTAPNHEKPIRINDTLLTVKETSELVNLLKLATKEFNNEY